MGILFGWAAYGLKEVSDLQGAEKKYVLVIGLDERYSFVSKFTESFTGKTIILSDKEAVRQMIDRVKKATE